MPELVDAAPTADEWRRLPARLPAETVATFLDGIQIDIQVSRDPKTGAVVEVALSAPAHPWMHDLGVAILRAIQGRGT